MKKALKIMLLVLMLSSTTLTSVYVYGQSVVAVKDPCYPGKMGFWHTIYWVCFVEPGCPTY